MDGARRSEMLKTAESRKVCDDPTEEGKERIRRSCPNEVKVRKQE